MNRSDRSTIVGWPELGVLQHHWFVVCAVSDLAGRPIARTLLGRPVAIFHDGEKVVALSDRCPHRNAPLSSGRVIDGCLQCPYHGWRFAADGHCTSRPGIAETAPPETSVESYATCVQEDAVWVSLDPSPESKPPRRPWYQDTSFQFFRWSDSIDASIADGLENLLDATHTPFVHSGLVRSQGKSQCFSAVVRVREAMVEAEYLNESTQAGWISRLFERNRASSFGRFIPPCIAELEYTSTRGTEFVLNSHFTPESADRLRVHSTIFLRRSIIPQFVKRILITPFFRRVLQQDRLILKLQQENIRRYDGPKYQYWEGDLLRGWIDTWLRTGQLPESDQEHRVEMFL